MSPQHSTSPDIFKTVNQALLEQARALHEPAGRVITCGFSLLQKIGRGAQIHMWFPRTGDYLTLDDLSEIPPVNVQWAAIRQVEILQESGNIAIRDLRVDNLLECLKEFNLMRAEGHRLVIVTGGTYEDSRNRDDLEIFDQTLRDRLQKMVNLFWLDELSEKFTTQARDVLTNPAWDVYKALPHVGTALGAMQLFRRPANASTPLQPEQIKHMLAMEFLSCLNGLMAKEEKTQTGRSGGKKGSSGGGPLPGSPIEHQVSMGLKMPHHKLDDEMDYIARADEQYLPFMQTLHSVFSKFDMISLDAWKPGSDGARRMANTQMQTTLHYRAYGDHMSCNKRDYASLHTAWRDPGPATPHGTEPRLAR